MSSSLKPFMKTKKIYKHLDKVQDILTKELDSYHPWAAIQSEERREKLKEWSAIVFELYMDIKKQTENHLVTSLNCWIT